MVLFFVEFIAAEGSQFLAVVKIFPLFAAFVRAHAAVQPCPQQLAQFVRGAMEGNAGADFGM